MNPKTIAKHLQYIHLHTSTPRQLIYIYCNKMQPRRGRWWTLVKLKSECEREMGENKNKSCCKRSKACASESWLCFATCLDYSLQRCLRSGQGNGSQCCITYKTGQDRWNSKWKNDENLLVKLGAIYVSQIYSVIFAATLPAVTAKRQNWMERKKRTYTYIVHDKILIKILEKKLRYGVHVGCIDLAENIKFYPSLSTPTNSKLSRVYNFNLIYALADL